MAEDWRVTFELADESGAVARVLMALHEHEVRSDARDRLGERVAVSGEGERIVLYADNEAAAREAERVVAGLLAAHDLEAAGPPAVERWHPVEERWEDARVPLPATAEERATEHERREADETAEALSTGLAEWEVRIEFASHDDAREFADRLEGEGTLVVRRWNLVIVGANDEDDARALAAGLAAEIPKGAQLQVEPGGGQVWQLLPENPFAVFGGLGG